MTDYSASNIVFKGSPCYIGNIRYCNVYVLLEQYENFIESDYFSNFSHSRFYCFKYLTIQDNSLPNSFIYNACTYYLAWYETMGQVENYRSFEYISGDNRTGEANRYYFARVGDSQFPVITPYEFNFILSDDFSYYIIDCVSGNSVTLDLSSYETYNGLPVKEIADGAFEDNTVVNVVTLPSSIEVIGDNAFKGCFSLSSINLKNTNLYSIGNYAFYEMGLTEIDLPETIEEIGSYVFKNSSGPNSGYTTLEVYFEENTNIPDLGYQSITYGYFMFKEAETMIEALQREDWQDYIEHILIKHEFNQGDSLADYFVYTLNDVDYQIGWWTDMNSVIFQDPYSSTNPYISYVWDPRTGERIEIENTFNYNQTMYGKIIT